MALSASALAGARVDDAWARPTVPGQKVAGVYMKITADADGTLVAAATPAARVAEIHEMTMEGTVMKMRPVAALPLKAGKTVELKPGGFHVMLIDVSRPLALGDRVPVTLTVAGANDRREKIEVTAVVRRGPPGDAADQSHKH